MRPNAERAQLAIKMIWIVMAIQVIAVVLDIIQLNILKELDSGTTLSHQVTDANDARQQYISLSLFIANIFSAITFIQWFRRAYFNLQTLVGDLEWDDSWVAGFWFIPIINLFKPFQLMREMYRRSILYLTDSSEISDLKVSVTPVAWWWVLWVGRSLIGAIMLPFAFEYPESDPMINMTRISIFTGLLIIPLAYFTVKVIREYSGIERLLENKS